MKPKNKTLSDWKEEVLLGGFCYPALNVKECFDRIKKRLFEENDESQNLNYNKTIFIINEEIGDNLK